MPRHLTLADIGRGMSRHRRPRRRWPRPVVIGLVLAASVGFSVREQGGADSIVIPEEPPPLQER